jgi:hypothetical protein
VCALLEEGIIDVKAINPGQSTVFAETPQPGVAGFRSRVAVLPTSLDPRFPVAAQPSFLLR